MKEFLLIIVEQHKKSRQRQEFVLLLLITPDKTHSESPEFIFTTEVRILVTKRRDPSDCQYLSKWLLGQMSTLIIVYTE